MTSLFEMPLVDMPATPVSVGLWLGDAGGRRVELLDFVSLDEKTRDGAKVADERSNPAEETRAELNERVTQMRAMVDAARAEAIVEARRGFENEMEERLVAERDRIVRLCAEFSRDRQQYFSAAETQVVKLALAVAKIVLGRELANDHLPMKSMVKAALMTIRDGGQTVLHVRQDESAAWMETLADQPVKVIADDRILCGEVVLETGMGRVELGVDVQLREIERSFEQLMQRQES